MFNDANDAVCAKCCNFGEEIRHCGAFNCAESDFPFTVCVLAEHDEVVVIVVCVVFCASLVVGVCVIGHRIDEFVCDFSVQFINNTVFVVVHFFTGVVVGVGHADHHCIDLLIAECKDVFLGHIACCDKVCKIICIFLVQLEEDVDNKAVATVVCINCCLVIVR